MSAQIKPATGLAKRPCCIIGMVIGCVVIATVLGVTLGRAAAEDPAGTLTRQWATLQDAHTTVWQWPTNLSTLTPCDPSLAADLGCNAWWLRQDSWSTYVAQRTTMWPLVSASIGGNGSSTPLSAKLAVVLYFPIYLADPMHAGMALQKLATVVQDVMAAGMTPLLFLGRPEFFGNGSAADTHDVVHNAQAQQYLLNMMQTVLQVPAVRASVPWVSVYWLAAAYFCSSSACSEAQILSLNSAQAAVAHAAGMKYMQHVDGPWWDGCWPQPCSNWNVAGYTPHSVAAAADALFAESWVQGSLPGGVRFLVQGNYFTTADILLVNDVPNCDLYPQSHPCSTGSLLGDTRTWFGWISQAALQQWSIWAATDGGTTTNDNFYGDLKTDGSGLTDKGLLHRQYALSGG